MRAGITTSCKSADTRYTRLNLLGWALLCPHARDLLLHGSTPIGAWGYPTAEEAGQHHETLKSIVLEDVRQAIKYAGLNPVSYSVEYKHEIAVLRDDTWVCARSKADIVYTIAGGSDLYTLYIETSTRIHAAKPWQALLRGLALYYERRLPTWIIIVSPTEIMYKILEERDQVIILKLINRDSEGFEPNPNLCSLCDLSHYCPYKVI